jgi:hypothetical protein
MMPFDVQWIRIMSVTMTAHAGGVQGLHSHRDKEGHRFSQLSCAAKHAEMASCPRKGNLPLLAQSHLRKLTTLHIRVICSAHTQRLIKSRVRPFTQRNLILVAHLSLGCAHPYSYFDCYELAGSYFYDILLFRLLASHFKALALQSNLLT